MTAKKATLTNTTKTEDMEQKRKAQGIRDKAAFVLSGEVE